MAAPPDLTVTRQRFLQALENERRLDLRRVSSTRVPSEHTPVVGERPPFLASILWGVAHARESFPIWRRSLSDLPWWPERTSPWHEVLCYIALSAVVAVCLSVGLWYYLPPQQLAILALVLTLCSWVRLVRAYRAPLSTP